MNHAVGLVFFIGAFGLIAIGVAGLLLSQHMFRMLLALGVAEAGGNLLLVITGFRWDGVAPILVAGAANTPMVDPVPQAMVLTSIVIGVGVQALALTMLIRIKRRYGTLDMRVARQCMLDDLDKAAGTTPDRSTEKPAGERPLPPYPAVTEAAGE